jgi:chemotaxis protein MotB
MMAFFLLMWLLGSTAKGDLEGIADHFQNPLKISFRAAPARATVRASFRAEARISPVRSARSSAVTSRRSGRSTSMRRREGSRNPSSSKRSLLERGRLLDLKGRLEAIIEANPNLRNFKNQILMDITSEGLRIQLVDEQNRPMFSSASAELQPYTRELLRAIARALNDVPNRLSLSGHTDSAPFAGGERGFSNWELSSNRANASRRELVAGGLEPGRVARVVGLAETIPFNVDDPLDPANRRISIIVMNKKTEEAVRSGSEGGLVDVDAASPEGQDPLPQETPATVPAASAVPG